MKTGMNTQKTLALCAALVASVCILSLPACGGGGGSPGGSSAGSAKGSSTTNTNTTSTANNTTTSNTTTSNSTATGSGQLVAVGTNPFASRTGVYTYTCKGMDETSYTLTISDPRGGDTASVTIDGVEYQSSAAGADCNPKTGTVVFQAKIEGTIKALSATKKVSLNGNMVDVQTAEFTYDAVSVKKGKLDAGMPAFGTKTRVGYLVDGNRLYFLSGSREADGLPGRFSAKWLTKQ